jgi:hypothetical protein
MVESDERSIASLDLAPGAVHIGQSAQSQRAGHRALDSPSCARRLKALLFAPTARGATCGLRALTCLRAARPRATTRWLAVSSLTTCGSGLILISRGAILRASAGAWHGTSSAFGSTDVERWRFGAYIGSNRSDPPEGNRARSALAAPEHAFVGPMC